MTDERFLTAADICARLQVSRRRGYQILREMPHVKMGRSIRVAAAVFEHWLKDGTLQPQQSVAYRLPASVEKAAMKLRLRRQQKRLAPMPVTCRALNRRGR